jgi:hypothetical protein
MGAEGVGADNEAGEKSFGESGVVVLEVEAFGGVEVVGFWRLLFV